MQAFPCCRSPLPLFTDGCHRFDPTGKRGRRLIALTGEAHLNKQGKWRSGLEYMDGTITGYLPPLIDETADEDDKVPLWRFEHDDADA